MSKSTFKKWTKQDVAIVYQLSRAGYTTAQIMNNVQPLGFLMGRTALSITAKTFELAKMLSKNRIGAQLPDSRYQFLVGCKAIKIPTQIQQLIPKIDKTDKILDEAIKKQAPELNYVSPVAEIATNKTNKLPENVQDYLLSIGDKRISIRKVMKLMSKTGAKKVTIKSNDVEVIAEF